MSTKPTRGVVGEMSGSGNNAYVRLVDRRAWLSSSIQISFLLPVKFCLVSRNAATSTIRSFVDGNTAVGQVLRAILAVCSLFVRRNSVSEP